MVQRVRSAVAVDFGTTTSLLAQRTGYRPAAVIPLAQFPINWLSSLAARHDEGYIIGEQAEQMDSRQLIRSVKRAVTERRQTVPLGGRVGGPEVPADDVIRAILIEVRKRALAEGRRLARVKEIRLGCPAMWDGSQRRRLLEVVSTTGMTVTSETLIEEPIAAGMAWLADRHLRDLAPVTGRLLVFDMGGGTLDVAVLDIAGDHVERQDVSVLASRGVPIAGDRIDDAVEADIADSLRQRFHCDLEGVPRPDAARNALRRLATSTKITLSTRKAVPLTFPRPLFGRVPEFQYTRDRLEELFGPLLAQAENEVWAALLEARLRERFRESSPGPVHMSREVLAADVDFVLLVGGMSQMPAVRRRMRELFAGAHFIEAEDLDPVEAVVKGLTDTGGYDRINLHRPGFDFVLEWDDGLQRRTLYEAHTPLYEPWQVASGQTRLSFERRGRNLDLPRRGTGRLSVVSVSGKPVELALDGQVVNRLPVSFGTSELLFKLYCDGQMMLTDGRGHQRSLRITRWPVIQGRQDAKLEAETIDAPRQEPEAPWYLYGEDFLPPGMR